MNRDLSWSRFESLAGPKEQTYVCPLGGQSWGSLSEMQLSSGGPGAWWDVSSQPWQSLPGLTPDSFQVLQGYVDPGPCVATLPDPHTIGKEQTGFRDLLHRWEC